ncbi:MAG: hypothetical protein HYT03_02025 [Candidatus Harrisonbacteria bacterium]|nr:hypothetical protein [Candidatus Harrisonbacteria bacterium]
MQETQRPTNRRHLREIKHHLIRNFIVFAASVVLAVVFVRSGLVEDLLIYIHDFYILGALVAGFFLAFVLTVGPAAATLIGIGENVPVVLIALIGALGSVVANLALFQFVKKEISDDFIAYFESTRMKPLAEFLKLQAVRWILPIIGAIIVASPLPDEIGLAMIGVSKIKTIIFVPVMYLLHFFGILVIVSAGRAIF